MADTGSPDASTGESVAAVREVHGGSAIWDRFARVTRELERALPGGNPAAVRALIRENHRLLVEIGVVPSRVAEFITAVESSGGAGKISGAGAVRGQAAGMVWVEANAPPRGLCLDYGYRLLELEGETDGVRLVDHG